MKNIIYILIAITLMSCKKEEPIKTVAEPIVEPVKNKLTFITESNPRGNTQVTLGDQTMIDGGHIYVKDYYLVKYNVIDLNDSDVTVTFYLNDVEIYSKSFIDVESFCRDSFLIPL